MRLGYFTMPVHPLNRPWHETLKEDREAIILAYDYAFLLIAAIAGLALIVLVGHTVYVQVRDRLASPSASAA